MKAALPASNASRAGSSSEVVIAGSAASEVESLPMISSAFSVGPWGRSISSGLFRMWPPADSTSALNQTTSPSYLSAWTSIRPLSGPSLTPSSIISSQVLGAFGTRSLRYQSSSVLDHNGAA